MNKLIRVSYYIDGFNLYFGMRSKFPQLKWLDVNALCNNLLRPGEVLSECNYFTARVRNNPDKEKRQKTYLDALATTDTTMIYGKFYSKPIECRRCHNSWPGNEEKMTDVNIAVKILTDAMEDKYDKVVVISGDSDLTPPLRALKQYYKDKRIIVAFPPKRSSFELKNIADNSFTLGRKKLADSQLPLSLDNGKGYMLNKPQEWN